MSLLSDRLEMNDLFRRQIRKRRFQTTPEAQNSDLRLSASSLHRCPNAKVPWDSLASHSIALRDENTEPVIRILVLSLGIISRGVKLASVGGLASLFNRIASAVQLT